MLRDDSPHNREAEAAPAPFGRVVRQKQLLALGRRDARAIVGHDDPHQVVAGVELRFDHDVAATLHRFDRVVDQVDDDTADLLDVEANQRHAGREALLDAHVAEYSIVQSHRIGDELGEVGWHGARRRHPREL